MIIKEGPSAGLAWHQTCLLQTRQLDLNGQTIQIIPSVSDISRLYQNLPCEFSAMFGLCLTMEKHSKNCKCCPVSLFFDRSPLKGINYSGHDLANENISILSTIEFRQTYMVMIGTESDLVRRVCWSIKWIRRGTCPHCDKRSLKILCKQQYH